MSMMRYEPFEALVPLRNAMNRMLEESFLGMERFEWFGRVFPLDIRDAEHEYIIEASLPGIRPDELQVLAAENTVTIRATRKREEKGEKTDVYVRRERYEGEMSRIVELPTPFDAANATAIYEHGVLTLRLPKAAVPEPKHIPVEVKEVPTTH